MLVPLCTVLFIIQQMFVTIGGYLIKNNTTMNYHVGGVVKRYVYTNLKKRLALYRSFIAETLLHVPVKKQKLLQETFEKIKSGAGIHNACSL